jgi:DNA repair exonuclease SbcCD ATPase subunit
VDSLPADTAAKIERQLEDSRAELKTFAARQHTLTPKLKLRASLSKLERLRTSLEEDRKKLDALEQQRRDQARLASSAARVPGPPPESAAAKAIKQQIKDAEARLIELRQRYTDEYPDVQDANELIEELRSKLKGLPAENPHPAKESLADHDDALINRREKEIRADQARLEDKVQRETAKKERPPKKSSEPPNNFALAYALELDRYEALLRARKTAKEFQGGEALGPMFTVVRNATTAKATGAVVDSRYWPTSLLAGLFAALLSVVLAHRFTAPEEQTAMRQEQTAVGDQELAPQSRHGMR